MVSKGFSTVNKNSIEKQNMTRDEFDLDISSINVLKYIAKDNNGETIGYMTVHKGLESITWADTEQMHILQLENDPDAETFYIGTMVVEPDQRGLNIAKSLLRSSYKHLHEYNKATGKNSLVFFDCADFNHPGIPLIAKKATNPNKYFEGVNFEITEYMTQAIVSTIDFPTDHVRIPLEDAINGGYEILDRQHYYYVKECIN